MKFSTLADYFDRIETTSSKSGRTAILASLLKAAPKAELPKLVYLTQGKLRPGYEGVTLGIAESNALQALATAVGLPLAKVRREFSSIGDIGRTAEKLLSTTVRTGGVGRRRPLSLNRVYDTLLGISRRTGPGSLQSKIGDLEGILSDATPVEARYIMRMATGELRLGVADYTMLDACSIAFLHGRKEDREKLEHAYNVTSDLGYVVELAAERGLEGISQVKVQVGRPIRPMLAERLESAKAILRKISGGAKGGVEVAVEYKLDGERVQVHKRNQNVILFSRRLENITSSYPDVAELAKKYVKPEEAILEGEVVAINPETGEYLPFQELMHRKRKYGVEEAMKQYPISIHFFDLLCANGRDYTEEPYTVRRKALEEAIQETERIKLVPAIRASDAKEIEKFMEQAISEGCEGVVVKSLSASYRAGVRGFAWIKLKREYAGKLTDTLDLVIIGGLYGRGRRAGVFGAYLLAAFDDYKKNFPSISKVGAGFSDEDLREFPRMLKPFESRTRPPDVESILVPDTWFRPGLLIEVIASEITLSPIHCAGMDRIKKGVGLALRFPRFTGKIRRDKRPEDATTVREVIEMYEMQKKKPIS